MKTGVSTCALVFVLLVACKSTESVATTTAPSATTPATPSVSVTPSASAAASTEGAALTVDQEIVSLAHRWNDALARRDAEALRDVYGAHVTMYGTSYDRAAAVAAKRAALAGDYTQSIASLMLVMGDPSRPHAIFDKTWTIRGKPSHVRASLAFAKEGGRWAVVEETDSKTEQKLAETSCLSLVHEAVLSTDDGKTYRGDGYGTMYVCGPPDCDTFQIAGIHLDEQGMRRVASFDVDQKKGVVAHAGIELNADSAIVARMKTACAKEAAQDP